MYYRASLVYISPMLEPERYKREYGIAQGYFRKSARLMTPELVWEEIPFEDYSLPAYYQPAPSRRKAPTLIMIGGSDTFVEGLYAYIGPAAQKRDWNLLIVDFPGQTILPYYGKTWRADAEKPMAAVIDHLLRKPEVDPRSILSYGISAGGYLVPRAVASASGCQRVLYGSAGPNGRLEPKVYRYLGKGGALAGPSVYQEVGGK